MKLVFILLFTFISFSAFAKLEDLFNGITSIEKPFDLRDPFKAPLTSRKKKKKSNVKKTSSGVYSNIVGIEQSIDLNKLQIIGVLVGKKRRAIVSVSDKKGTFVLKEGMKLGKNNATIRAIVPGGIILVEKVTNIYGEDEYLETVIPISR